MHEKKQDVGHGGEGAAAQTKAGAKGKGKTKSGSDVREPVRYQGDLVALVASVDKNRRGGCSGDGPTALLAAVQCGQLEAARLMLKTNEYSACLVRKASNAPADADMASVVPDNNAANARTSERNTPLSTPASSSSGSRKTITPLIAASVRGDEDMVRLLLHPPAPCPPATLSLGDAQGRTAIHWAALGGEISSLRLLLKTAAAPQTLDDYTHSSSSVARSHEQVGRVVDITDDDGRTALSLAAEHGQTATARLLLTAGGGSDTDVHVSFEDSIIVRRARASVQCPQGRTPLM